MIKQKNADRAGPSSPSARSTNEGWRQINTGRLLYNGFEWYNFILLDALQTTDFEGIRHTHLNLLRHLDAEGTRMTDLAARSKLTKAAITALVRSCRDLGFVSVENKVDDGRTRVVRFTARGCDLMLLIEKTVGSIERRVRLRLGKQAYDDFRVALLSLSALGDA